jgi:hypothetical protein
LGWYLNPGAITRHVNNAPDEKTGSIQFIKKGTGYAAYKKNDFGGGLNGESNRTTYYETNIDGIMMAYFGSKITMTVDAFKFQGIGLSDLSNGSTGLQAMAIRQIGNYIGRAIGLGGSSKTYSVGFNTMQLVNIKPNDWFFAKYSDEKKKSL